MSSPAAGDTPQSDLSRPSPKPPFDGAADPFDARDFDSTPIGELTLMRVEPWRRQVAVSLRAARPDLVKAILHAIEFGVPIDFVGDRTKSRVCVNPPIDSEADADKMH